MKTSSKNSMKSAKIHDNIFYWSVIILPVIQFIIFYIIVNANSFLLALKEYDYESSAYQWGGLKNFQKLFLELKQPNSLLVLSIQTSVKLFFLSFLNVPFGLFLSFYVYKKMPCFEFFKVMLFLPQILSSMVMALLYMNFVDSVIPELLLKYCDVELKGGIVSNASTRFAGVFTFEFFIAFGGSILMYVGAMSRIPESVVEYSILEGISPVREFFTITLPLIMPTVGTFVILRVSAIFTNQMHLFSFFGKDSQSLQTVGYRIYVMALGGASKYPEASANGIFFTLFATPLTILIRWLVNKYDAATY